MDNDKRHCTECNYHLDDYEQNATVCGACCDLLWYSQDLDTE